MVKDTTKLYKFISIAFLFLIFAFGCVLIVSTKKQEEVIKKESVQTFIETSDANSKNFKEKFIYEETKKRMTGIKRANDSTIALQDNIGVQRSMTMDEYGNISLRFIFETASEEETFTIKRKIYTDYSVGLTATDDYSWDKDEYADLELNETLEYTCVNRYTAINDGGNYTYPREGYKYFFVYILENIPAESWYSYIRVQTTDTETSLSNAKAANVNGMLLNENYYSRFNFSNGVVTPKDKTKVDYFIPEYQPVKPASSDPNASTIAMKGEPTLRIGDFTSCNKASIVRIPSTANTIIKNAFKGCPLTNVLYGKSDKAWYEKGSSDSLILEDATPLTTNTENEEEITQTTLSNANKLKRGNEILVHNQENNNGLYKDFSVSRSYWRPSAILNKIQYENVYKANFASINAPVMLRVGDKIRLKKTSSYDYSVYFLDSYNQTGDNLLYSDFINKNTDYFTLVNGYYEYTFDGIVPGENDLTSQKAHLNYIYVAIRFDGHSTLKNVALSTIKDGVEFIRCNQVYDTIGVNLEKLSTKDYAFYGEDFKTVFSHINKNALVLKMGSNAVLDSGYSYTDGVDNYLPEYESLGLKTLTVYKVTETLSLSLTGTFVRVDYNGVERGENQVYALSGNEFQATNISTLPEDLFVVKLIENNPIKMDEGDYEYNYNATTKKGTLIIYDADSNLSICSKKTTNVVGRTYGYNDNVVNTQTNKNRASTYEPIQIYSNESISITMQENIWVGLTVSTKNKNGVLARNRDLGWFSPNAASPQSVLNATYFPTQANKSTKAGETITLTYQELVTAGGFTGTPDIYITISFKKSSQASGGAEQDLTTGVTNAFNNEVSLMLNEIVEITAKEPEKYTVTIKITDDDGVTTTSSKNVYALTTCTIKNLPYADGEIKVTNVSGTKVYDFTFDGSTLVISGVDENLIVTHKSGIHYTVTYENFSDEYTTHTIDSGVTYSKYLGLEDANSLMITLDGQLLKPTEYSVTNGILTVLVRLDGDMHIKLNPYRVYYNMIEQNKNYLSHDGAYTANLTIEAKEQLAIYRIHKVTEAYTKLESSEFSYTYTNGKGTLTINNIDGYDIYIDRALVFDENIEYWNLSGYNIVKGTRNDTCGTDVARKVSQNEKLNIQIPKNKAIQIHIASYVTDGGQTKLQVKNKLMWMRNQLDKHTVGAWLVDSCGSEEEAISKYGSFYTERKNQATGVGFVACNQVLSFTYEELCLLGGYDIGTEIYVTISYSYSNGEYFATKLENVTYANKYFSVSPKEYNPTVINN